MRAVLALFVLAAMPLRLAHGQQPAPASAEKGRTAAAEKLNRPGLPNLGRVTPVLYRGGQPKGQGYEELKSLGIEIVVSFRNEKREIETERANVGRLGMGYVSIPWSSSDKPENKQVAELLQFLHANPEKKIFVHCRRGAERTGVMMAAFRITTQQWSAEQALAEMEQYDFRGFWFRHLKDYVRNFPAQLQSDPTLRALQPTAAIP